MKIYYSFSGRFGNNIIQYIAAKLLSILSKRELIYIEKGLINIDYEFLTNKDWLDIMNDIDKIKDVNYFMNEFYQRGDIFLKYRDIIINQILSINNTDSFYNIKFMDIFKEIDIKDELVVHLRLDDFINQGSRGNVVEKEFFIENINKSEKKEVIIIVDKIKFEFEKKYIFEIIDKCKEKKFFIQQSDILNDWNTIRCAKSVISSNSSFCWIACFLGMIMNKKEKIIFPNTRHYDEQLFNINTNIFCSVDVNLFSI